MRRYRRNPDSNKARILDALLAKGDIARNDAPGEVRMVLDKAAEFIQKYALQQYATRLQQLNDKLQAYLRGERVERDDHASTASSQYGSTRDRGSYADWSQRWRWYREKRHGQRTHDAEYKKRRKAYWDAWAKTREGRADEPKQEAPKAARAPYHKPRLDDTIIWVWTLTRSPKRGKAGDRWAAYYGAKTVREMLERGGRWSDVKWNITHNLMKIAPEGYEG